MKPRVSAPTARVVLITAPDSEVAMGLARTLVGERLAACVNLVEGVASVYRWEGQVEQASEVLMVAKTDAGCLAALERRLLELHPYDVPELIALAPEHVEPRYASWLTGCCAGGAGAGAAQPGDGPGEEPDDAP